MKLVKFIIALVFTVGLVYLMNNPINTGNTPVPAVGKLFNPFSGFWQNAERVGDYHSEQLNFSQLSAPVKVVYDNRMVPHIFAQNNDDATFVQGYITAQHRLWQMDISTRATSGRLAEILGPNLIKRDKIQRRKGLVFAAYNALKAWKKNPVAQKNMEAYTAGVNAWIIQLTPKDYPIEFKLMDYTPEPWTELKTAIFVKSMAESLCSRENDLESTNALNVFGRETFDFLYPEYNPKQDPIIPTGTEWKFDPIQVETKAEEKPIMIGAIPNRPFEKPDPFWGSNNWAVAGSKTASGNPILCSDPHLMLNLPSIWYEMQIHLPKSNAYGVSLPGIPGIIIGFNEDIAWGQTNVGHDVMDWYKIKWANEKKDTYLLDGKEVEVEWRHEKIGVKGAADIIDTVKYTKWGPIVHDDAENAYQDMALRWLAHDEPNPEESIMFFHLNQAKNYQDFSKALTSYVSPAQNFVFAAKNGDIAIKVNGRLPIKRKEQGRFVQDGSSSNNAWSGYIPMDQIPQMKNPARGFVASANQNSTAPDYPYYYNGGFEDYRGRILNRKLAAMNNITAKDMMKLQNDTYSLKAEEVLPLLLKQLDESNLADKESGMLKILKDWDYRYDKNKVAPILFDIWYSAFYKATWDEIYALDKKQAMLFPETWRTIALLHDDPNNIFFDDKNTAEVETAQAIARSSFNTMITKVEEWTAKGNKLEWANYKKTKIGHLGQIPAFSSDLVLSGGSGNALNAIRRSSGPSWRMVVELGDKVTAHGIYPGGQSGNPGSPFYDNMIDDWANGKYNKLIFVKSVSELADQTLLEQNFN